ncbi:GNAT family N-acetyltransferase [Kocuria turfanensis]|uniref:GNAT family N-acetyltransferase n=1 Tax=Kocuria turfanensis TaxID=388357 RepID=UPI0018DB9840|nr:GNAT family N-acetyltransferase [Kocuria turfanensis]
MDDRVGVRERWGVPSELLWFTSAEYYIGSVVIRHRLIEDEGGEHIGYHVVHPWERQGHATQMLRSALEKCKALGIVRALLTVAPDDQASLTVVRRNGGVADGVNREGELRFWVDTSALAQRRPLRDGDHTTVGSSRVPVGVPGVGNARWCRPRAYRGVANRAEVLGG